MRRQPGSGLFFRGPTENIQAKVMTRDGRQKLVVTAASVLGCVQSIEVGGLDRPPRRQPQGVHSSRFVENLRDVSAAHENGHSKVIVFNTDSPASVI